jgi:cytochrome c5
MRVWIIATAAFVCTLQFGCGKTEPPPTTSTSSFADAPIGEIGKQRWARTCAMCHVRGEGGAPKIGDAAAWKPRLAQGEAVLLDHTINGFNNMPPLGYCMDCERDDLRAYIDFMASGGGS